MANISNLKINERSNLELPESVRDAGTRVSKK